MGKAVDFLRYKVLRKQPHDYYEPVTNARDIFAGAVTEKLSLNFVWVDFSSIVEASNNWDVTSSESSIKVVDVSGVEYIIQPNTELRIEKTSTTVSRNFLEHSSQDGKSTKKTEEKRISWVKVSTDDFEVRMTEDEFQRFFKALYPSSSIYSINFLQ